MGGRVAAEVAILRIHVAQNYILQDHYIDPAKCSPLICNFRHYFRVAPRELAKTFRAEA